VGDRDLRLTGVAIMATFRCPRGTLLRTSWGIMMNPSDHMKLRNKGRTPLFTRQTVTFAASASRRSFRFVLRVLSRGRRFGKRSMSWRESS
jgi:hypothetical protein